MEDKLEFTIKPEDSFAPRLLGAYMRQLIDNDCDPEYIKHIQAKIAAFREYYKENIEKIRYPNMSMYS